MQPTPTLRSPGYAPRLGAVCIALLALVLLVHPRPAHGGQVHSEDLSLEELLAPVKSGQATLALVTLATPEHKRRAYPVPGGRGKRCAPYDFIVYEARVDEVVRGPKSPRGLAMGRRVAIVPANVPGLVRLEHLACVEGISKSPIWPRYKGLDPAAGTQRLVVLRQQATYGWLENVAGAWLDPADLPRIKRWFELPEGAPIPPE